LLIACNKSDLSDAKSADKVKSLLEAELEQLKSTSGSLGDIGGDNEDAEVKLGKEGKVSPTELPMSYIDVSLFCVRNSLLKMRP
jgi:hypothetical protein